MPRIHRLAGALTLALAASGAAQAQQFSNVISFGDSLSDAGNIAQLQGLPAGNSFTTNPDGTAAQLIAAYYGFNQTNTSATGSPITNTNGTNYAYGGACIQASGPCVNPSSLDFTRVPNQVTTYLSRNNNAADPNALFTLWAGANDIFAPLGAGLWTTQTQIQAGVVPIATSLIGQASRLQAAGANYIVVFNLPDLGRTPQFIAAGTTAASAATLAAVTYNSTLNAGLASLGDGIIPVNTYALVNEVLANPAAFGFSNVTGIACGPGVPGVVTSVACGPAGSGLPYTYASGTNNSYLFADGVHPSGGAHRLLSQVVVQTIAAPSIVSMAPEVALKAQADHQKAVEESALSLWSDELESGTVRGYAALQGGNQDIDGDAWSPGLDGSSWSLTLGANYRMSDNFVLGGAVSVGNQDADTDAIGNIDGVSVIGSAYVEYQNGGFYLRGQAGGGSSTQDITRRLLIGPLLREHVGSPGVEHVLAGAETGYMFGDGVRHGPFLAFNWSRVTVEGYREEDNSSTAMNFDEFERKSQQASVGYQITGDMEGGWRPFVRVAWVDENKNETTMVNAGSNSMNGRFTMAGHTPSEDWWTASIGLSAEFETFSGFLSLNGRFGDDQQDSGDVAIGVTKTF